MNIVVLANLVSMIGCIMMVGVGFLQKKRTILLVQCVQFGFLATGNLLLGAMTGFVSGLVSIARNMVFLKWENTRLMKISFVAVQLVLSLAGNALTHVPDSALTLITGLISAYLISARLPALVRKLPRERLRAILSAWKRIRTAVGGWLLAQGKLMGVSFAIVLAGLLLLRVRGAFLWAVGISLVDAFPILGIGTVLLPWAALDFLQGDTPRALGLLGIWVTVSVLRSVLEPKLLGKQLGLDPLVTLMALYAGYKLLGIAGIILAPLLTVTALQLIPKRSDKL